MKISLSIILLAFFSTQIFAGETLSFGELNGRLKADLAPHSPSFENAFPCGEVTERSVTIKSVYDGPVGPGSADDDTSVWEVRVLCENSVPRYIRHTTLVAASYEEDMPSVRTLLNRKSEYKSFKVAGEFEYLVFHLIEEVEKDSVKFDVSTYETVTVELGSKQVEAIHLVASYSAFDEDEWVELGRLDYTFGKGLSKSRELVKEDSFYFYPGFYAEHRQSSVVYK